MPDTDPGLGRCDILRMLGVLVLEGLLGVTVLLWGYGERIILALLGG